MSVTPPAVNVEKMNNEFTTLIVASPQPTSPQLITDTTNLCISIEDDQNKPPSTAAATAAAPVSVVNSAATLAFKKPICITRNTTTSGQSNALKRSASKSKALGGKSCRVTSGLQRQSCCDTEMAALCCTTDLRQKEISYTANTTDSVWICVFCKRGPHCLKLGDLFGPYLISNDCEEYKTAVRAHDSLSKRRRIDMVQLNSRNLPVVPALVEAPAPVGRGVGHKKKKKASLDDASALALTAASQPPASDLVDYTMGAAAAPPLQTFLGMCKVSESNYEVWMHEDCTIWAPSVFLVGTRLMGLGPAVWISTSYQCVLCSKPGAIISCLQRDCKAAAHVPCARESHWQLNEANLHVYCQKHRPSGSYVVKHSTSKVPWASSDCLPVFKPLRNDQMSRSNMALHVVDIVDIINSNLTRLSCHLTV